ncbi:YciI family protein [Brevibacterium zhoupengii]|uniref:YciI family protein n=1 Tax=Brevibacterium zhoupengii TaxID=2898795 RepID=UPI001E342D51|nr:YciI family protein [Brevibacterium zhoupengii]
MSLFAVTYSYAAGSDTGRDEHRPLHLEFLKTLNEEGTLVVSGPTDADGPEPGALLIIRGESTETVNATMEKDPFAQRGYVQRTVQSWDPKFGASRLDKSN